MTPRDISMQVLSLFLSDLDFASLPQSDTQLSCGTMANSAAHIWSHLRAGVPSGGPVTGFPPSHFHTQGFLLSHP